MMRRSTCLWLLAAWACSAVSGAGHARDFGGKLSGSEILLQMDKRLPTTDAPGIYAMVSGGEPRRVLSHGRHPAWSPDHRRIAYLQGGLVHIADLDTRETTPADLQGGWVPCPSRELRRPSVWLQWTPDSTHAMGWQPWPRGMAGHAGEPFTNGLAARPDSGASCTDVIPLFAGEMAGWRPSEGPGATAVAGMSRPIPWPEGHVGRLSFAPDGLAVAFERIGLAGGPAVPRAEIRIFSYRDGTTRLVEPAVLGSATLCNPLWAPTGDRLAVDFIADGTFRRRTAIVDVQTMQATELEASHSWLGHMQALQWSPDGAMLLVREARDGSCLGDARLSVCRVGTPMARAFIIGPASTRAAWSPSGREVAALCSDTPWLECATSVQLLVFSVAQDSGALVAQMAFEGALMPVDMDW